MSDNDLVELWAERAAIIQFVGNPTAVQQTSSSDHLRRKAERLAYFEIRRLYNIKKMPDETFQWSK